ncbi:MAG: diguanylate cyclase [Clostridia bacterium]|nr:diguanylate cyclase [Clostridia bacterium]MBR5942850.1 diguanylate cyclase [Clostridia bacterium]
MYYSLIGVLALLILLITNHDVLFRRGIRQRPVLTIYRRFLLSVIAYYVTDILWGAFDYARAYTDMRTALFIDTEFYFIAMALGILFWTHYVSAYLRGGNRLRKLLLRYSGIAFFVLAVGVTVINIFTPIMFSYDENGDYHVGPARNAVLILQIVLFLITAVYALYVFARDSSSRKKRHLTIGLFGVIMLTLISIQFFFPYLPLYAIGYMLGCCLLRTFVIEIEKNEYRRGLETSLDREKQHLSELDTTRQLAYTDALTGAQSKLAYMEKEDEIDKTISDGSAEKIAFAVFDVNMLKMINDTKGHDAGDACIYNAYRIICDVFRGSPVYRVGGDEFVAVLEGENYDDREALLASFDERIEDNLAKGGVVVSAGVAEYIPGEDSSAKRVFARADMRMYARKDELKRMYANVNGVD